MTHTPEDPFNHNRIRRFQENQQVAPMMNVIVSFVLCVALLAVSGCTPQAQNISAPAGGGGLTGKVWAISQLNGKSLLPGSGITAEFSADGKVSGSSGCNRYSGSYTTSGDTITFSSPMAATMMACDQAVMDQETAYLKDLGDAKTYSVQGDQLTLSGAGKSALVVYNAQSQDLAGTSWEAVGYNNGKQAVTSVLAGTTLSADFGKDGNLSGNAGCNTYSGPYKVTGNQITIGPLASTRKACADPAGVMEQETQYLEALQTAATYQMEGNSLELRTKDGALAADFSKK
jgi:heat shock protein HslJ